mmetsp:Transcript_8586/g.21358  ORF Transcript_8586/g.21358 Transcript_8586/m.21358 type:complete len:216 (+) Transcript_8586:255-902(+)
MPEARVQVRLRAHRHDLVEVVVVHVRVNPEQPPRDALHHHEEVAGKLGAGDHREDRLVAQLLVRPVHHDVDVLGRGQLRRRLVLVRVLPQILILGTRGHRRAALIGAALAEGAVDETDLVEEVEQRDADPVVGVVSVGNLHGLAEVSGAEGGREGLLGQLVELVARVGGLELLLGLEGFVAVEELGEHGGRGVRGSERVREGRSSERGSGGACGN